MHGSTDILWLSRCDDVCSLRVNLDMGKAWYSWVIQRDVAIPGTTVRSTTIPEELGRINYLLTDKTGTLTQNDMVSCCALAAGELYSILLLTCVVASCCFTGRSVLDVSTVCLPGRWRSASL